MVGIGSLFIVAAAEALEGRGQPLAVGEDLPAGQVLAGVDEVRVAASREVHRGHEGGGVLQLGEVHGLLGVGALEDGEEVGFGGFLAFLDDAEGLVVLDGFQALGGFQGEGQLLGPVLGLVVVRPGRVLLGLALLGLGILGVFVGPVHEGMLEVRSLEADETSG